MRTGLRGISGPSAFSVPSSTDEHQRAANGYFVWPLALAEIVREHDDASIWARLHARQALVFGLLASVAFVIVLALPLLVVIAVPSISTGATIAVYGVGLLADVVGGIAWLVIGLRFAVRAARGELFSIPLVTPIVDRWLPVDRP